MEDYFKYFGCVCIYKDHQIIDICDLEDEPSEGTPGSGNTYVQCGECGSWMVHRTRSFKCPGCGITVNDSKVFMAIHDENKKMLKELEELEDEYDEEW